MSLANIPPFISLQVIKAICDYQPDSQNPQELPFSKGDFFHVISREDALDWYEACNPLIPSARGLVPVSFFEVIGKNERDSLHPSASSRGSSLIDLHHHNRTNNTNTNNKEPHDSGFSDRLLDSSSSHSPSQSHSHSHSISHSHTHSPSSKSFSTSASLPRFSTMGKMAGGNGAMVYGVVQYDFQAERPDELEAKAGEAIIVIAQSNPEWFVAKPIGRLGGPGLIPVSFLELRDMQSGQAVTDPLEAVNRAGVPKVEEWKKMTAEYKNSSITLGKIDSAASGTPSAPAGAEKMPMGGHMSQNGNAYVSLFLFLFLFLYRA